MTRTPNGPTVRALDVAVAALLDQFTLGVDSPLFDHLFEDLAAEHRDTLRAAVDRARRRADALSAAEREVL